MESSHYELEQPAAESRHVEAEPTPSAESAGVLTNSSHNVQGSDPGAAVSSMLSRGETEFEADFYYETMSNFAINVMFAILSIVTFIVAVDTIVMGIIYRTKISTYEDLYNAKWLAYTKAAMDFLFSLVLLVTLVCYGVIVLILSKPRTHMVQIVHICIFVGLIAGFMGSMPLDSFAGLAILSPSYEQWSGPWVYSLITGRIATAYFYFDLQFAVDYASFSAGLKAEDSMSKWNLTRKLPGLAPLFVDKIAYGVVQVALALGFAFGLKVYPTSFSWTSWVVLIRSINTPSIYAAVDAKVIAVTVIMGIVDLLGLVIAFFKLRHRTRELFALPFYRHAKSVLYLRLQKVFTWSLWVLCLFFGLLYFNIIMPIDFVLYPLGDTIIVGTELVAHSLGYLLFSWVILLTVLFLPASYPGLRGLYMFRRVDTAANNANQRADFQLTVFGNDPTINTQTTKRVAFAPRTFYWDCVELALNFSKLAYGPSYSKSHSTKFLRKKGSGEEDSDTEATKISPRPPVQTNWGEGEGGGQEAHTNDDRSTHSSRKGKTKKRPRPVNKQATAAKQLLKAAAAIKRYLNRVQGYRFVADIKNKEVDSRAIIFESGDRTIVAFRGTASGRNVKTDLDASMVELFSSWQRFLAETPQPQASAVRHGDPQEEQAHDFKANLNSRLDACVSSSRQLYESMDHWTTATRISTADYSSIQNDISCGNMKVHSGFLKAYVSIRHQVTQVVRELYAKSPKPLLITGHSLGGAMATLCSLDLLVNEHIPVQQLYVVNYGSPKVGNKRFASMMKHLSLNLFRVVNSGDIISKIPKRSLLGQSYSHSGSLALIDTFGNLLLTPSVFEKYFVHRSALGVAEHRLGEYNRRCTSFSGSINQGFSFWTNTFIDILDKEEQMTKEEQKPQGEQTAEQTAEQMAESEESKFAFSLSQSGGEDPSEYDTASEYTGYETDTMIIGDEDEDIFANVAMSNYHTKIFTCM